MHVSLYPYEDDDRVHAAAGHGPGGSPWVYLTVRERTGEARVTLHFSNERAAQLYAEAINGAAAGIVAREPRTPLSEVRAVIERRYAQAVEAGIEAAVDTLRAVLLDLDMFETKPSPDWPFVTIGTAAAGVVEKLTMKEAAE
jgi:hypothetical protein